MWADTTEEAKMLDFIQGDGTFESWFMEVFTKLDTNIEEMAKSGSILGRAIGIIGATVYLSIMGWRMQNGEAEWSVEPMLRPIIILIFLINWTSFYPLIQKPLELLSTPSEKAFEKIEKEADDMRTLRFVKQIQVLEATRKMKSEAEAKKEGFFSMIGKGEVAEAFENQFDKVLAPISDFVERLNYQFQKFFGEFIEMVGLIILRVAVYFIFFIQKIWSYILIVLGPLALGMATFPGFEHSFNNWVAKFININLYGFIAFTILNIGQQLIMTGFQMDIERLSKIVDSTGKVIDEVLLIEYTTHSGMLHSALFPVVGYLVTAVGVLMTPTIADTIVSAGGAGVMTKAKAAAGKVGTVGRLATKGVAGSMGRVGSAMGKDAKKSATSIRQAFGTMKS
ncbi:hypothetical protein CAPN002_25850 [Capnocytophaga stomatis]|nr:hypothetical protein CAPN002_25850 [Capnocytophaga stomatis]